MSSPENIFSDQNTRQTDSEEREQDQDRFLDDHIPDQTLIINRRPRKSAEKEYSNIQQRA